MYYIHLFSQMACLEETAVFEIFFDDNVCYGIEHKLDVLCVCGTGHVGVDFFDISSQVQIQELQLDVVTRILKGVGTWQRHALYF